MSYNIDGYKEILGMWVGENESSKYWLMVLNILKDRGLEDILIISTDNLPGFIQVMEAVYPQSRNTKVHNTSNKELYEVCIIQDKYG